MSGAVHAEPTRIDERSGSGGLTFWFSVTGALVLLAVIYAQPVREMVRNWGLVDSYYSHGYLIVPICLYLVWLKRDDLARVPRDSSPLGYLFIIGSSAFLLLGSFLGFLVFQQLSIVPMLAGISLVFLGKKQTKVLWFPIVFLLFMIPMPGSVTQSIVFDLKMLAAGLSVRLAQLMTLPMIHDGSYIRFKNDALLIGNVCGGLRSLIALLAIGTLMAYFSQSRSWARWLVLLLSGPIAIAANVFRIFVLCIVAYFWGSGFAGGTFHEVSGLFIFGIAFVLFFFMETTLRRVAPTGSSVEAGS